MRPVLLALLAAVLVGSGGAPIPRLSFGYDASRPLGLTDRGVVVRSGGAAVHDVSFLSGGRRVAAYLVVPRGTRRHPAIVLVPGAGGDREQLLPAGLALAARGLVALTITPPSASPPPRTSSRSAVLAQQREIAVTDAVAVRRAVQLLRSLPSVDGARIGYLGWSAGARTGALVAAAEPHVRALALLSAGADPISAYAARAPKDLREQVRTQLGSVDPLRYVGRARGALLLEDGTRDEVVPHEALLNMVRAAPRGTTVRWYDAGHALNAKAFEDAFAWLRRELR